MDSLLNEINQWPALIENYLGNLGYSSIQFIDRGDNGQHTHLVWLAKFKGQSLVLKVPSPFYLEKFLTPTNRENILITYWKWAHRSALHHRAVTTLISPASDSSSNGPPVQWVPGFGCLYEHSPEQIDLIGELLAEKWDSAKPFLPFIVMPAHEGKPLYPQVSRSFNFLKKRYESAHNLGRRLCVELESLSNSGVELLDFSPEHIIQTKNGRIFFRGLAHTIITKWQTTEGLEFGGGVTDGLKDLISEDWKQYRNNNTWQDYLPRIGAWLQGIAKGIQDPVVRKEYDELGHKLESISGTIEESTILDYWDGLAGQKKSTITREYVVKTGHFVDVENCRWSVLGLQIDLPTVLSVVENLVRKELGQIPSSNNKCWAAIPHRDRDNDICWWGESIQKNDFEFLIPETASHAGDESDDRVLIEKLEEVGPCLEVIVIYTSEGRKFSETASLLLEKDAGLKIWVVGFGEISQDWHKLSEKVPGRLRVINALDNFEIVGCIKGEF